MSFLAVKASFWFIALLNAPFIFRANYLACTIKSSCMNVRKWIKRGKRVQCILWLRFCGIRIVLQCSRGKTDSTSALNSILLVSSVALYASIIFTMCGRTCIEYFNEHLMRVQNVQIFFVILSWLNSKSGLATFPADHFAHTQ